MCALTGRLSQDIDACLSDCRDSGHGWQRLPLVGKRTCGSRSSMAETVGQLNLASSRAWTPYFFDGFDVSVFCHSVKAVLVTRNRYPSQCNGPELPANYAHIADGPRTRSRPV